MVGADSAFAEICTELRAKLTAHAGDDEWFGAFRSSLFETSVSVLEKLRGEGFFKAQTGHDVFLDFSVSDSEFVKEERAAVVRRLNDNDYRDEYLAYLSRSQYKSDDRTLRSPLA